VKEVKDWLEKNVRNFLRNFFEKYNYGRTKAEGPLDEEALLAKLKKDWESRKVQGYGSVCG